MTWEYTTAVGPVPYTGVTRTPGSSASTFWMSGRIDDESLDDYGPIDVLNKLGSEGWELVTVIPGKDNTVCMYYFKRPRGRG